MKCPLNALRLMDVVARFLRFFGMQKVTRMFRCSIIRKFPEGLCINFEGLKVNGAIEDRAFLYDLQKDIFENETIEALKSGIREGMVVLDVGAYLGIYSLIASRLVGSRGVVYAFEPDPIRFHFLVKNINENKCENIIPVNKAVSNWTKKMRFYLSRQDSSMNSLVCRDGFNDSCIVDAIRLDDFMDVKADIVKLDVEGSEVASIMGMKSTIECATFMLVEVNSKALKCAGSSDEELTALIRDFGFSKQDKLDEHVDMQGSPILWNILCQRG